MSEAELLLDRFEAWIHARKRNDEAHAVYSKSLADLRNAEEALAEIAEQMYPAALSLKADQR